MTTMRRFVPEDMFRFNNVNLDKLTETYHTGFYLGYLAQWPDIFYVAETAAGKCMGYIMGKVRSSCFVLSSPALTLRGRPRVKARSGTAT